MRERLLACALGLIGAWSCSALAWAAPPRVVSAEPDNGDVDVDPGLTELRIEFDQDMSTGGQSICGGGANFPKIAAKPRWEGARTIIVPVALEVSHDYSLSVNCQSFRNFRSASGEPAEIYPIAFKTAAASGGSKSTALTPAQNRAAIAALRKAIDEKYSYRDLRGVDWNKLFDASATKLESAKKPGEFAREAARVLANAEDIHISLAIGSSRIGTHKANVSPNCNVERLAKLVPNWTKRSESVYSGRFEDGIGYLLIASWATEPDRVLNPALAALEGLADAKGLIIDVRPNGGGDEPTAQKVAGCFADKAIVYSKNRYRDSTAAGGFGRALDRTLTPNSAGPHFKGKVAVLMGPACMSSNESFLLMMQVAGAKLVGERSYGSSGNPKPVDLGNGVTVFLPSWEDLLPDGSKLEGRGVNPDVPIRATAEQLAEQDPVLEAGLRVVRAK